MKNRTEEASNYEIETRNKPFKLLEEIKIKIRGQVRAKCKFTQATDVLVQFFKIKQEHSETSVE